MSIDERMRTGLQQAYESLDSDVGAALEEVETMATKQKTRRGIGLAVAASAVVIAGLVWGPGLVDSLGGESGTPVAGSTEDPAAVLTAYEDARNARDWDALRALYADDAVITGHPLDEGDPPIADVDEILALEMERFDATDEQVKFVNVEVSADRATFAHLFFADDGNCYGSLGDQADEITVRDGKITTYTWDLTSGSQRCDPDLVAEAGDEE